MDVSSQDISVPTRPPWGFWATIGFSLLAVVILLSAQAMVAIVFVVAAMVKHPNMNPKSLESNGLLIALAVCFSTPIAIAASVLFAKIRGGPSLRDYFRLHNPRWSQYVKWTLALLVFIFCSDALSVLLGIPAPQFMVDAYRSAGFTPLLWFAFIIAAPLGEEVLFRGFLFKGLLHSRVGPIGAILISSLGWAALHTQYDPYGVGTVFVGGLLLAVARLKSDSIYIPIMMHVVWSVIATAEVAIYLRVSAK